MFRLLKWTAAPAIAFAMTMAADAPQAEAGDSFRLRLGGVGISVGGGHHGHHGHHGYRHRSYRHGHAGHHRGHYGHRRDYHHGHHRYRRYHDTSHFDYHPPQLIPHRGHFDYVPGHYDFHRSGHWHH